MDLTIRIDCDNAAFDEDNLGPEVARILRGIAAQVEGAREVDIDTLKTLPLHDINGNKVGTVRLAGTDKE